MSARKIAVGTRVVSGRGDDKDTGIVHAINGEVATVGWDSGVVTPCDIAALRPTTERWSGGNRIVASR